MATSQTYISWIMYHTAANCGLPYFLTEKYIIINLKMTNFPFKTTFYK